MPAQKINNSFVPALFYEQCIFKRLSIMVMFDVFNNVFHR